MSRHQDGPVPQVQTSGAQLIGRNLPARCYLYLSPHRLFLGQHRHLRIQADGYFCARK
jgi:hypothetical protein